MQSRLFIYKKQAKIPWKRFKHGMGLKDISEEREGRTSSMQSPSSEIDYIELPIKERLGRL